MDHHRPGVHGDDPELGAYLMLKLAIAVAVLFTAVAPATACIRPNDPFCDIMDWPY